MKQILQYLWFKEYYSIKNKEFNFTRRADIHFDYETRELTIVKNDDYCEDFFDDNIEISCVVGQNGAGKTTLLRAVMEIYSGGYISDFIAIFYDGSQYSGWYKIEKDDITFDKELNLKNRSNDPDVKKFTESDCLFYSEHFSQALYRDSKDKSDISTSYLLFKESNKKTGDPVNQFFIKEFERQIDFVIDYGEILEKFNIRYTPYAIATLFSDNYIWEKLDKKIARNDSSFKENDDIQRYEDLYYNFFPKQENLDPVKDKIEDFKVRLAKSIFLRYMNDFLMKEDYYGVKNDFDRIFDIMQQCKGDSALEKIRDFMENVAIDTDGLSKFIKYIDTECQFNEEGGDNLFIDKNRFIIPTRIGMDESEDYILDLQSDIKDFYSCYKKVASSINFIDFSWSLSSGESSLLNIFSRIYNYKCQNKSENEVVMLLLDEIDVTLHPEWQRMIVNGLLNFLKETFDGKYVQVIMTTHSPIMLSDIPKQNVLFLKNENGIKSVDGCNTFASNIFQLFREGFFIGDTGIGVYAEEKLKEIVEHIHNNDIDDGKLKKLIAAVGDTFLRNKLNEEYLMYRSKKNETEELQAIKIAELETSKIQLIEKQREERKKEIKIIDELLKKLEQVNKGVNTENKNRENNENSENRTREYNENNKDVIDALSKLKRTMEEKL